jgi:SulP family sulfate permease
MPSVAGAISASAIWNFGGHGIQVIGPVAGGLPHLGIPAVSWRDLPPLIPLAASCSIMIITQSAATARIYANRHHQPLDENADLAGLAGANATAGLSGTFIVNGSPTQTAMVEGAGAQSQIAQLSTAAVAALVLLFFIKPLAYWPHCVLGALVFMIAIRLINFRSLADSRPESPGEFALAITTASVVVVAGVEQGILLAMVLSLLRVVQHNYHPHTGVMVKKEDGNWKLNLVAPVGGVASALSSSFLDDSDRCMRPGRAEDRQHGVSNIRGSAGDHRSRRRCPAQRGWWDAE